jgi:hypothetical protein
MSFLFDRRPSTLNSMHPGLVRLYGTEKVSAPKEWKPMKGGLPLAALVGGTLLYHGLHKSNQNAQAQQGLRQDYARGAAANRLSGTDAALRGGVPLDPGGAALYRNERADSNTPGDFSMFDKGAAAIAEDAGRLLAKQAGIGGAVMSGLKAGGSALSKGIGAAKSALTPGMGTKLLAGGALVGGGLLAAKAGKSAYNYGMAPTQERTLGGHNAELPSSVNQFGQVVM